jgi:DNA-binding HxlR family transcriptional regulator
MTKRRSFSHMPHGIAAALDVIGEWWTPLVVRSVFKGNVRFEAVQSDLGVARNILTDRLNSLVEAGVLRKVQYNDRPVRFEYHLTDMGRDLYGVLITIKAWGDKWVLGGTPAPVVVHSTCNSVLSPAVVCRDCREEITFEDTHIHGEAE